MASLTNLCVREETNLRKSIQIMHDLIAEKETNSRAYASVVQILQFYRCMLHFQLQLNLRCNFVS